MINIYVYTVLLERPQHEQLYQLAHLYLCPHVLAYTIPDQPCQHHHILSTPVRPGWSVVITTHRVTWPAATTVVYRVTFSQAPRDQQWPAIARTTATTPTCARLAQSYVQQEPQWLAMGILQFCLSPVNTTVPWMSSSQHNRMSSFHLRAGRPRCLSPSTITNINDTCDYTNETQWINNNWLLITNSFIPYALFNCQWHFHACVFVYSHCMNVCLVLIQPLCCQNLINVTLC